MMSSRRTYLDWNAGAPLRPAAREAMVVALDVVGNPSSPHAEGRRARAIVEAAREEVAALVRARPAEVVFTSGGTEANNAAIAGGWQTLLLAGIEHDSVLAPARRLAGAGRARLTELPVGLDGIVAVDTIGGRAGDWDPGRSLLTLQLANNETGIVQPMAAAAEMARSLVLALHTDAVQAVGRIPVDVSALGVDYLSLSAHKLGGPKGIGALVIRDGAPVPVLIAGGGQERRRRAGTENVAAIAGFGAAAREAARELSLSGLRRVQALRDTIERESLAITPNAVLIGADADRLPNTTCIALPGASAETLVIALDLAGIAVSAGAACSSGKVGASHVLAAMGLAPSLARSAVRVSLGASSTSDDVAAFLQAWAQVTANNSDARTRLRVAV